MSKENSDKSVLGGVFMLIIFAIYILGIVHTANNFSKDKALSAFLIPPYGFYMGVKSIFNPNSNGKDQFPEDTDSSKNAYSNSQISTSYSPKTRLQLMDEMVANMNQGLPRTENGVRLDQITVVNDHTYGYDSTILNIPTYTDELLNNYQTLKQALVVEACSAPQNRKAAQSGASAVMNYYAVNGSLLVSIEITPVDCGF